MAEYVNPFLRGVMGTRAANERSAAQEIGILSRLAQLQMQQQAAQQAAEMRPLQMDALRSQIEERNAKVRAGQQQQQALGMLSRLQSPEGSYTGPVAPGVPTAVAGNEQDALRQVMEAEAQGRPMAVNVPNQGNVRTLASLAFPAAYGKAQSEALFPKPEKPTTPRQNIVPVTGGYLQPDANGAMQFVRTQEPGSSRQPRNLQLTADADGNQLIVHPDGTTSPLIAPGGGGVKKTVGTDKPLTEFQGKAVIYGTRAAQSHKILDNLEEKISLEGLAATRALGSAGNYLRSSEQQRVDQAQRDFVNAILRQESGAVISDAEFANAQKQYFPQPGDTKETIAQKRANRKLAINGFARSAGKGAADIMSVLNAPLLPSKDSGGGAGQAPEGVDPALWGVMTPQERALWQK